jgi:hypothetical protein
LFQLFLILNGQLLGKPTRVVLLSLPAYTYCMVYTSFIIEHCTLLSESFFRLTGNKLIQENLTGQVLAEAIYHAPFVLVSHGTEIDPIFNFANLKAQELWEMSWEEFTKTPSRLSASSIAQTERQKLLEEAKVQGYVSNYNGVRISKSGKKFHILNTILYNVMDTNSNRKGQAAVFKEWRFL